MEEKQNFDIKQEGDKIVWEQTITRTMSLPEAMAQHQMFKGEVGQVTQKKMQLEASIKAEHQQKQLDSMSEDLENLISLDKKWGDLVKPALDKLYGDLLDPVRKAKKEKEFARIKEPNARAAMRARIIADLAFERKLDVAHPVFRKLSREFDKL